MAKDCLILPCAGADLGIENRWAQATINLCKSERVKPWSQFCRGLAEYRQGHFENAVEWMQAVLTRRGDIYTRDVEALMVLAMAQKQLHQTEEARASLAAGIKTCEAHMEK